MRAHRDVRRAVCCEKRLNSVLAQMTVNGPRQARHNAKVAPVSNRTRLERSKYRVLGMKKVQVSVTLPIDRLLSY